jgi:hypothetical protein
LELLELKRGHTVKTFIPKVAEGVFTVICMFNQTDEYVLYYHSGKKTLRVFRHVLLVPETLMHETLQLMGQHSCLGTARLKSVMRIIF